MACTKYWFSAKQARMRSVLGGAVTQVRVGNSWREYTATSSNDESPGVWDDLVLVAEGENCETAELPTVNSPMVVAG